MSWAVSLQAVFAWFIGYLRYAVRRRDQGTGADPHPEMDYSESFIEKDIPPTEDGQEPDCVSDEMTEPSQKNPLVSFTVFVSITEKRTDGSTQQRDFQVLVIIWQKMKMRSHFHYSK